MSLVSQAMIFTTKIVLKLGNAERALSRFMVSPGNKNWAALRRLMCHVKGMNLKGTLYLELE